MRKDAHYLLLEGKIVDQKKNIIFILWSVWKSIQLERLIACPISIYVLAQRLHIE